MRLWGAVGTIQYNWSLISPFILMHAKLRSALSLHGGAGAIVMQRIVGSELAQGPYVVATWSGIRTRDPLSWHFRSSLNCIYWSYFDWFMWWQTDKLV